MALGAAERNGEPVPDEFRYLEDYFVGVIRAAEIPIWAMGQERTNYRFGRWSPDFVVEFHGCRVLADVKIRHRDYPCFLIESAPLHRALCYERLAYPTIFVLVADDPLEIVGYATAEDVARHAGEYRNDHRGNGSGDWYHLIPARILQPFDVYELR